MVVSDSSPLVTLARLAHFDLLRTLFSQVYISAEVLDDYEARRLAKRENVEVRGTLGVLETSFRQGHLADLRGAFAQLRKHSYIDPRLLNDGSRAMVLSQL